VALTFLLSAAWKVRHSVGFSVVIAGAARRPLPAWSTRLGPFVVLLEIVIATGLLLGFPEAWASSLAAALFLIAFSVFLARADSLANGCGCWQPARRGDTSATPYLVRNAVLIVLAAIGAAQSRALSPASQAAVAAIALLPAWLVMEVPTVLELLRPAGARRVPARLGAQR
jgi:uncharacterized membrane protein YphA (DoxX/SURF4 family)